MLSAEGPVRIPYTLKFTGPALRPPRSDARASARVDEMASFAASYVFPAVEHGVVKPRLKMQQVKASLSLRQSLSLRSDCDCHQELLVATLSSCYSELPCHCIMQGFKETPLAIVRSAWQQSLTKAAHVACCSLQEGAAEEDIVAKLADGVDALRPVLAEVQERGFRRGPAAPLLRADQPTWADFYLLPPLADLAGIPEGSVLQGALPCGISTLPNRALSGMRDFAKLRGGGSRRRAETLLHVVVAHRLSFVRLWRKPCGTARSIQPCM